MKNPAGSFFVEINHSLTFPASRAAKKSSYSFFKLSESKNPAESGYVFAHGVKLCFRAIQNAAESGYDFPESGYDFQGSGGIALVFVGNWGYAPDQGSSYDFSRRSGPGVKLCFFQVRLCFFGADQARSQAMIFSRRPRQESS